MLNQFIDIIKDTTITTIISVMGLFGMGDVGFLDSPDVNLSDFAQANISEAINSDVGEVVEESPETINPVASIDNEDLFSDVQENQVELIDGTEYFIKEDLPEAIFARPEPLVVVIPETENIVITESGESLVEQDEQEEFITLGEGLIEDVRVINPIKPTKVKKEVDVSLILETNFDEFDSKLQIVEITEDEDNFFVAYQYITLAVEDKVWKVVLKEKNISINKNILEGKDLGNYLSEELAEVINTDIVYLKEVQEIQIIKKAKEDALALVEVEESTRTVATDYSSLIGKVLDIEEIDFGDYIPFVKDEEITEIITISDIITSETEIDEEDPIVDPEPVAEEDNTTSTGVVDNQAPLLVIQGNNPALVQIGTSYVDLGAKVTDNISEGLGVHVGGDVVDTSVKGSYFVIYTATDEAGNVATATREVIVYDYGVVPEVPKEDDIPVDIPEEEIVEEEDAVDEEDASPEIKELTVDNWEEGSFEEKKIFAEDELGIKVAKKILEEELDSLIIEAINRLDEEVVVDMSQTKGEDIYDMGVTEEELAEIILAEEEQALAEAEVDTVIEVVEVVADTVVEAVSEGLENVKEATEDIVEEVTASLGFVNVKGLFGDVNSFAGKNNTAQILSNGVYELIGSLADNFYNIFNIIYKKIKTSPVGEVGGSFKKLFVENTGNLVPFISFSYNKIKEAPITVISKLSGVSSLAGIKYSKEDYLGEELVVDEIEEINKTGALKEKVSAAGRFMKYSLNKTLDFFKNNKPAI